MMQCTRSSLLLVVALACGSTAHPSSSVEPRIEYFVGRVTTTSPDGVTPYGPPTETVARREFFGEEQRIEELVFHDGALRRTTLTQQGQSAYAASDDAGSFTGTIAFEGEDPFVWSRWTYEIQMSDGSGTITGAGERSQTGFSTVKTFSAGGAPRARIAEVFTAASEAEYDAKLEELSR